MVNVCDYEKYIRKHQEELDKEELDADRQKLNKWNWYQQAIKNQFKRNIDKLHNQFYDYWGNKYPTYQLDFQISVAIKEFADFLKENI
ncbi:MAG: hypothetical protein PWR08_1979 [Thermoanaerobacterium sp.]|jgi:hypothetical protein|nr:hypothetical protein [Thermoanaerobacterium sp.]